MDREFNQLPVKNLNLNEFPAHSIAKRKEEKIA